MRLISRLTSIFGSKRTETPIAPLAPTSEFFVIGDIHGRDDLLADLLEKLDTHPAGPDIPVICVGDLIDRGDDSAAVLSRLHARSQNAGGRIICLMGNHEEAMLRFLKDPERHGPFWLRFGGLQTLASFKIDGASQSARGDQLVTLRDRLQRALGDDIVQWISSFSPVWSNGNVWVVHAGADPTLPMDQQDRNTLVWGHSDFLTTPRKDGQWVIHGHTIVDRVTIEGGRIAVDTGAYATGRLSAAHVSPSGVTSISVPT